VIRGIFFEFYFVLIRVISWFQSCRKNWGHEPKLRSIKLRLYALLLLILAINPPCNISQISQKPSLADLVVINAKVRTMTSSDSIAEAFAVSGNRIIAIGSNKLIRTLIGPSTRVIDAQGRLVLPGFNDSHVHFMAIGNSFSSIDLRYVTTATELTQRISRYVRFLPKGRWILGGHFKVENSQLPDRKALDGVSPDNPIFLYSSDSTTALANSQSFKRASLNDDSPDIDRDSSGSPTGIVRGIALQKIAAAVPADHMRNWIEVAETATNYAASLGVTSVQDMHSDDSREIYRELQRQGRLKTRIYDCLPLRDWKKLKNSRLRNDRDAMVTDGCLKGFSDGDEDAKATLLRDVTAADAAKLQVMIHAIGRDANRIVLDVFEQTAKLAGRRDRRFRVEHAHKVRDEDLGRFVRSEIIASMQPALFDGSSESRFGTLMKQKARVAFGSDASMIDLNPLLGIEAAVNAGGESVSVYDAVRAYTLGSAFAEFREKEKGTIEVGKLADFVILSDDIFTIGVDSIRNVTVSTTVVDGKIVFEGN
jgi:predicted amidohydrolase YtcJ